MTPSSGTIELSLKLPGKPVRVSVAGPDRTGGQEAGASDGDASAARDVSLASARADLIQARRALEDGLRKLHELQQQVLAEAEEQLLDLAIRIARKVLMQEIQAGRYDIEPIVKEALLRVPARKDVVVHMNLYDWATCKKFQEECTTADAKISFVADPSVRRGECFLETTEGRVDFSVERSLEEIAEVLKGET